eukprot:CAMPEP_0197823134 /NCGR_PEP_ID=MMETSP1437-20131217/458_1 /TAXON_ID=49252 ORGANISM="Eucampia antarctica, Strain CCMP1452" /NCGR_SAMPLE_ID=MMETSP1437 /ASSEMBLY_ACC=CAM_ASM_001096 /LENGTH=417 /DNA_ID=CAMNT_0043422133 /DNA_START=134 /DNA_END=1387 /DNA_ORIENTATION=+
MMMMTILSVIFPRACLANAISSKPASYNLTPQQIIDYQNDGVIVIRKMLQGEILQGAIKAANKIQRSRGISRRILYRIFPAYRTLSFQTYREHKALKKVAFDSTASTICAKLMGLDSDDEEKRGGGGVRHDNTGEDEDERQEKGKQNHRSLRLLKDAVLGFSKGDNGCGWHIDDRVFWPCEDSHNDNDDGSKDGGSVFGRLLGRKGGRKRDVGVNVWITLSPVTVAEGGGLAVAPGSHCLSGKGKIGKLAKKARKIIRSGGNRSTCMLEQLDPECNSQMDELKRVYDLQPGDAIVHDRYLFHKPDRFKFDDDDDDDNEKKNKNKKIVKQRISLRYMPSDATFFDNGMNIDGAHQHKNLVTGDPLWKGGEYFPQTWPYALEEETNARVIQDQNLVDTKFLFKMLKSIASQKIQLKKKQ